jgi:hypothetical protein
MMWPKLDNQKRLFMKLRLTADVFLPRLEAPTDQRNRTDEHIRALDDEIWRRFEWGLGLQTLGVDLQCGEYERNFGATFSSPPEDAATVCCSDGIRQITRPRLPLVPPDAKKSDPAYWTLAPIRAPVAAPKPPPTAAPPKFPVTTPPITAPVVPPISAPLTVEL